MRRLIFALAEKTRALGLIEKAVILLILIVLAMVVGDAITGVDPFTGQPFGLVVFV